MSQDTSRQVTISSRIARCAAVSLALFGLSFGPARADAAGSGDVILELRPDVTISDFTQAYHTTAVAQVPGTSVYRVTIPAGVDSNTFLQSVASDTRVVSAERDDTTSQPEANATGTTFQWTTGFNATSGSFQ